MNNTTTYMTTDNYSIEYVPESKVFVITDRNHERLCENNYKTASEAIEHAEKIKLLVEA